MIRSHAFAAVLLVFSASPSLSQTAPSDRFLEGFRSSASVAGLSVTWGSASPNADGLLLGQVEVGEARTGRVWTIERIMVEGITLDDAGRAVARRMVVSDEVLDIEGKGIGTGVDVAINGMVFEGVATPAPESEALRDLALHYDRMSIGNVQVMINGDTLARFDDIHASGEWKGDERLSFAAGIRAFSIFTAEMPWLLQLGYQSLSGSASMSGNWSVADGRLSMKAGLDVVQAFSIENEFELSGYTRDLYAMATRPGASAERVAMSLTGLSIDSGRVSFEDKSLVRRPLDLVAVQKGKPVEVVIDELVAPVAAIAPSLYADREMGAAVATTFRDFLRAPGTLSVVLAPATPVRLMDLSGGLVLIGDRLGMSVTRE